MERDTWRGRKGNKLTPGRWRPIPGVRKVPADSVPYGESISHNGKTVWAAYADDGTLVCVAATAPEARSKYRAWMYSQGSKREG
jgi:hypothetical protein